MPTCVIRWFNYATTFRELSIDERDEIVPYAVYNDKEFGVHFRNGCFMFMEKHVHSSQWFTRNIVIDGTQNSHGYGPLYSFKIVPT